MTTIRELIETVRSELHHERNCLLLALPDNAIIISESLSVRIEQDRESDYDH